MTTECHHVSPVCVCHWLMAGLWLSAVSSKKIAFHLKSDSTRQIIISVCVYCLPHQLFLPVLLRAQRHTTTLIKFQISFSPPFPVPSPSLGNKPRLSCLNLFLPIKSQETRWMQHSEEKAAGEIEIERTEKEDTACWKGNIHQIKADIAQVWPGHPFLCQRSASQHIHKPYKLQILVSKLLDNYVSDISLVLFCTPRST